MTVKRIVGMGHASALLFLGGVAFAQSAGLSATPQSPQASAAITAQPSAHRAEVVYDRGQLRVTADDSSLNQILHDIAFKTGMKLSGSVTDERVYGKYGPGAPARILASLLDGTGCNMVLTAATPNAPAELILTPRQGGSTVSGSTSAFTSTQPASQNLRPREAASTPAVQPAAAIPGQDAQAAGASDTPPAVVERTPQQIYEHMMQLRDMQQQQQKQQH